MKAQGTPGPARSRGTMRVAALRTAFRAVGAVDAPALVVQDRDDPDVPSADAGAIPAAWPGATLLQTSGLGHRTVIRDPAVIAAAVAFLQAAGGADTR